MTKEDIACYRKNYDYKAWAALSDDDGWVAMPIGVCAAVEALCSEVERLQRVIARRKK